MTAAPAGLYRRTPVERSDQRIAWERHDQAFFASGACHILAWTCRQRYPDRSIQSVGMRFEGEAPVFHVYAAWEGWAFDHSGWNPEADLLDANAEFEGRPIDRVEITSTLLAFCEQHYHRPPDQYWRDPRPRAYRYIDRVSPPWI